MEPKIKRPLWEPWRLALLFAAAIPLFPRFQHAGVGGGVSDRRPARRQAPRRFPVRRAAGQLLIPYLIFLLLGLIYARDRFTSLGVVLMWLFLYLPYLAVTTVVCNRERLKTALTLSAAVAKHHRPDRGGAVSASRSTRAAGTYPALAAGG